MMDVKEAPMEHDKVDVRISQINNGFVFHRTWHEKKKGEGKGPDYDYMTEEYFVKELPGALKHLFKKGYLKDMESDETDWDKAFDNADMKMKNDSYHRGKKNGDYEE